MKIIFAVDRNWSIGYDGDMLFKISKDLKRFKNITIGNIIVMGRKTFESLPDQKPLVDRINIVVTRDKNYSKEGIIVVNDIEEMFLKIKELNPENKMDVFLIGGGNLTKQLIDHCDFAYITKVNKNFEVYDTYIPNLDQSFNWEMVEESKRFYQDDLEYRYVNYRRIED